MFSDDNDPIKPGPGSSGTTEESTTSSNTSSSGGSGPIKDTMEDEDNENLYDDGHTSMDLLDIQKELEAKFDELFGPPDDDNNN